RPHGLAHAVDELLRAFVNPADLLRLLDQQGEVFFGCCFVDLELVHGRIAHLLERSTVDEVPYARSDVVQHVERVDFPGLPAYRDQEDLVGDAARDDLRMLLVERVQHRAPSLVTCATRITAEKVSRRATTLSRKITA